MDATDLALGVMLILLIAWVSIIQLNLGNLSNNVATVADIVAQQEVLFSPQDLCGRKEGMSLVMEGNLNQSEYFVTSGTKEGKKFLCFYESIG